MTSSLDRLFSEMSIWKIEDRPVQLVVESESSRSLLLGYVADVRPTERLFEVKSDARDLPIWRFSIDCIGVTGVEEKGFDVAVLEGCGELFDDLTPEERGRLWVRRFEVSFELAFPGAKNRCVLFKLPL